MKELYLTQREIQFLYDWFIATTKGEQCEPISPRNTANQEDKEIYEKLKKFYLE